MADDNKWSHIEAMWAGLGLFLFLFGCIVLLPMWNTYQSTKVDREIVRSCAGTEARIACVKEFKKALD